MIMTYFVLDIETVPVDIDAALSLDEESRKKLLNPIDSRIIGIGIRANDNTEVRFDDDEKKLLTWFWNRWKELRTPGVNVIGFNIHSFDMPIIVARSFINDVPIVPFSLTSIIDIRDKLNAYRREHTRGRLKEYAKLLGIQTTEFEGEDVLPLYVSKHTDDLEKYLARDVEITEALYLRAERLGITKIIR